jgi:hypothetical protein
MPITVLIVPFKKHPQSRPLWMVIDYISKQALKVGDEVILTAPKLRHGESVEIRQHRTDKTVFIIGGIYTHHIDLFLNGTHAWNVGLDDVSFAKGYKQPKAIKSWRM